VHGAARAEFLTPTLGSVYTLCFLQISRFERVRKTLSSNANVAREVDDLMQPMRDEYEASRATSSTDHIAHDIATASGLGAGGAGNVSLDSALGLVGDAIDTRGLVGHAADYVVVLTHGIESHDRTLSHLNQISPAASSSSGLDLDTDNLLRMPSLQGIGLCAYSSWGRWCADIGR